MHLGFIMDGNGRWAKQRSLPRFKGHQAGLEAAKRIIEASSKNGVDYVTLYVFSTENWKRPAEEVSFLMNLMASKAIDYAMQCQKENVKILVRGNVSELSKECRNALKKAVEITGNCSGLCVVLAINYGGRDEIVRAVNRFNEKNPGKEITEKDIRENLDLPYVPDVDMIVRSAGEKRTSNFVLWDSAYSEFFSLDTLWPDWTEKEVEICLEEYSKRNRKYGGLNNESI